MVYVQKFRNKMIWLVFENIDVVWTGAMYLEIYMLYVRLLLAHY
jgi:hypothetical protein